jgi:hypothetical protein
MKIAAGIMALALGYLVWVWFEPVESPVSRAVHSRTEAEAVVRAYYAAAEKPDWQELRAELLAASVRYFKKGLLTRDQVLALETSERAKLVSESYAIGSAVSDDAPGHQFRFRLTFTARVEDEDKITTAKNEGEIELRDEGGRLVIAAINAKRAGEAKVLYKDMKEESIRRFLDQLIVLGNTSHNSNQQVISEEQIAELYDFPLLEYYGHDVRRITAKSIHESEVQNLRTSRLRNYAWKDEKMQVVAGAYGSVSVTIKRDLVFEGIGIDAPPDATAKPDYYIQTTQLKHVDGKPKVKAVQVIRVGEKPPPQALPVVPQAVALPE